MLSGEFNSFDGDLVTCVFRARTSRVCVYTRDAFVRLYRAVSTCFSSGGSPLQRQLHIQMM